MKTKSHLEYIFEVLKQTGNYSDAEAKEISFHLAEIIPDFELLSDKIKSKKLTGKDIEKIMAHVPYHINSAEQITFKRQRT